MAHRTMTVIRRNYTCVHIEATIIEVTTLGHIAYQLPRIQGCFVIDRLADVSLGRIHHSVRIR